MMREINAVLGPQEGHIVDFDVGYITAQLALLRERRAQIIGSGEGGR